MTSNTCDKYDQIGRKTYVVSESVRIKMLTTTGEDLYFLTTMVMACTVDLRLQVRDLDIVYKEIAMMQITKLAATARRRLRHCFREESSRIHFIGKYRS